MILFYERKAKASHERWAAAKNIGEDKEAAKHLSEYDNYQQMIKQQKGK